MNKLDLIETLKSETDLTKKEAGVLFPIFRRKIQGPGKWRKGGFIKGRVHS